MFLFGGFSTILPYAIYLSLVWICILIGFKGKLLPDNNRQFVSTYNEKRELSETSVYQYSLYKENNKEVPDQNYFYNLNSSVQVNITDERTGVIHYKLPEEDFLSTFSFRGPPLT